MPGAIRHEPQSLCLLAVNLVAGGLIWTNWLLAIKVYIEIYLYNSKRMMIIRHPVTICFILLYDS